MKRLDPPAFDRLIEGAVVLGRDRYGRNLLRRPDGRYVKLMRQRSRPLSTAAYRPYALRFVRNTRRLAARGVTTVAVREVFRAPCERRDGVVYDPLPGTDLRAVLAAGGRDDVLDAFAGFLADLHDRGVYFRALRLGNVLVLPDGRFALVDVADCRFATRPLGPWRRGRNFRPLVGDPVDAALLAPARLDRLVRGYLARAAPGPVARRVLLATIAAGDPALRRVVAAIAGPPAAATATGGVS
ncbi:MAG: BUD32 family EKC/KEOPS complex subunit [Planctomycetota bacterium]|jgi:hypothetical protein